MAPTSRSPRRLFRGAVLPDPPAPIGPKIASNPIEITLIAGATATIKHDLGRPIAGWLCIWADAPVVVYVDDPSAPTYQTLILRSDTSATARFVILA